MSRALDNALAAIRSDDAFAVARARALVTVYHETWWSKWNSYDVVDVEVEFTFPLLNPETESSSRTFVEAGKMDALLRNRVTGNLVVLEHKTTSDDVVPESDYWDRLRMDSQVSKYFLAAHQRGESVDTVLYDVMRKPGQRPASIPLTDRDGFKVVLDRNGQRVFTKDGKKPRETGDAEKGYTLQTRPETPDEFEARLLSVLRANPGEYYAHREAARMDSDILEFMNDEWSLSQQILYFRKQSLWPRNPAACKAYNTRCEFFDLCCGRSSVDGIRYSANDRKHAELKIQGAGDKELLTNSRAASLRKCARDHQFRYEQGIRAVRDEDPDALKLGTLVHLGLEHYFLTLKENNTNEHN